MKHFNGIYWWKIERTVEDWSYIHLRRNKEFCFFEAYGSKKVIQRDHKYMDIVAEDFMTLKIPEEFI